MKNMFKYVYSLLAGALVLTAVSCSDEYDYEGRGTWDADKDYADIYFNITDSVIELDPADPTTVVVTVKRRNAAGALSVPFKVLKNTDEVFEVGKAEFAENAEEATLTINFPQAAVGTTYNLQIMLDDPAFVSKYSSAATYNLTLTRVKWNDVGFYYDEDGNKVEGYAMYTDDVVSALFGIGNETFPTRIQERDDMPGYFRLSNTYGANYPWNDPGDWDESQDYYIFINATNPDQVYIPDCNMGVDWGYGFMHVYSMAGLGIDLENNDYIEGNYGTYANGKITFPKDALLFGMEGYKDFTLFNANNSGAFCLVIDPDLDPYIATPRNDDFAWEKVFDGAFISEKLGTTKDGVALYKGIAKEDVESASPGCYDRFAELYGTPYLIESPYVEGKNIIFGVLDGQVKVIEGLENQDLGIKAVGDDVYGVISAGGSSFTDAVIKLKITFQNKKGDIEYGTAVETLANLTWTEIGTGVYTYGVEALSEEAESYYEGTEDATLYQCNELPEQYILKPWAKSEEGLKFTLSAEDGKIRFYQYTGEAFESYGDVYFVDLEAYNPEYTEYLGEYDEETKTYEFCGSYYIPSAGGGFGLISETFVMGDAPEAMPRKAFQKKGNMKSLLKPYQLPSRFQPRPALKNASTVK